MDLYSWRANSVIDQNKNHDEFIVQREKSRSDTSKSAAYQKVAVLGSGVMGSRIACHFAHIGLDVLLLDIVPFDLTEEQKTNSKARNQIVNNALKAAVKSKPSPIYHQIS